MSPGRSRHCDRDVSLRESGTSPPRILPSAGRHDPEEVSDAHSGPDPQDLARRAREAPAARAARADERDARRGVPRRRAARRRAVAPGGVRSQRGCPRACEVLSSPALRCLQTAAAAGLEAHVEPDLAECDFGAVVGPLAGGVHCSEPEAARAWMTDPSARPHGGESLTVFAARVDVLARRAGALGRARGGDHARRRRQGSARARARRADREPSGGSTSRPLAITELHAHDGRWTRDACQLRAAGRGRTMSAAALLARLRRRSDRGRPASLASGRGLRARRARARASECMRRRAGAEPRSPRCSWRAPRSAPRCSRAPGRASACAGRLCSPW